MSDKNALQRIGRGSAIILIGFVLGTAFQYLYKIVLARILGPSDFGVFIQGMAIMQSIAAVALLGLSLTIPRYVSFYSGRGKEDKIDSTIATGSLMALASSIAISLLLLSSSEIIALKVFSDSALIEPLRIFAVAIPFFVTMKVVLSLFQGQEDAYRSVVLDDFLWSSLIFLSVGLVVFFGYGIVAATIAYMLSTAVSALIAIYWYRSKYSFEYQFSRTEARRLLVFSWPLLIISIFGSLNRWFDVLMLGWLSVSADAGIYDVAFSLSGYVAVLLEIVGFMFLPVVSGFQAKNDSSKIREIYRTVSRWMTITSIPMLAAILVFPKEVIELLFGAQYVSAAVPLSILGLGFFYKVLKGPAEFTLISLGKTRRLLIGKTVIATLIVFLNLLLIPIYGLIGAAVSTLIAYLIGDSIILYYATEDFGGIPHNLEFLKIITVGAAVSLPIWIIDTSVDPGITGSIILGLILTAIYIFILHNLGLIQGEDVQTFRKMLEERLQ